jgi:hypothetical protein
MLIERCRSFCMHLLIFRRPYISPAPYYTHPEPMEAGVAYDKSKSESMGVIIACRQSA